MSNSNITGSSNLVDLSILVNNLTQTVNNVSSAFSTVQTNISNLNLYDTRNTAKINQIDATDGLQENEIQQLVQENISDDNRLDLLELKFPITNSSILNETISKQKISGLSSDLTGINTSLNTLSQRITDLNTLEVNDVNTLTTNLNNQISKQALDNTNINNSFNTLLASVPGSNNTFQQQIDVNTTNISSLSGDNTVNKSNISSLQGDNTSNKNRLTALESDNTVNKSNISSLESGLSTANTNISNNTNSLNTLSTNLTTLSSKEAADVASLQNQINSLSNTSGTNNSSLQTQITNLSSKQQTDYNDLQSQITTNKNTQIADKSELISKITDNLTTETNHYNSLSTALNALSVKEAQDVSNVQSNLTTYQASNNTRSTNIEGDVSLLKIDNSNNKVDISNLKSDNNLNKANITTLQSKVSTLEADNSVNKSNITSNTNDISTINSKLITGENNITNLQQDVNNLKSYDTQNTTNINNLNNNVSNNTNDINLLKNTTIPNLDNKFLIKSGDTMTGTLNVNNIDASGNLNIGSNASNINLGSSNNNDSKVINIGGPNDTVNILGALNSIETTNTKINDKLITLNKGAVGNNQAGLVGFQLRDNDDDNKGYITTNFDGSQFLIKPPQSDNIFKIKDSPNEFYDLTNKLYVDLQTSALQSSITGLTQTTTELSNQITTINNTQLDNIPFNKINAYPSTVNYVMLGNGSFSKVNNNNLDNNSINPTKLTGCSGDATTYLAGDGLFKSMPTGNFTSSTQVVNSNIADNSINVSKLVDGVSKTYVDNKIITNSNITDNSINVSKLVLPNDGTKYLSGDGTFKVVSGGSSFNNNFTADVNANSHKIINVADPTNDQDCSTKSYVDNKYLSLVDASILTPTINPVQPTSVGGGTLSQVAQYFNVHSKLNVDNNNIINVADPVNSNDAANKNYVDNNQSLKSYADSNVSYITSIQAPYTGNLSGVSCKILNIMINNNNTLSGSIMNNLIAALGGSTSNITITDYFVNSTSTVLTYNSTYDVVIYGSNGSNYNNIITLLNTYYNNGKGVILGLFSTSTAESANVSRIITNYASYGSNYTASSVSSSNHPILYGVNSINGLYFMCPTFTSINGATTIGSVSGTNLINYLDDNTLGRRVDLNYIPACGTNINNLIGSNYSNDTTTTSTNRITLQACLWAAKKIGYNINTTTKIDFSNPLLPNLQVSKSAVNDNDVINKFYLSNNIFSLYNNNRESNTFSGATTYTTNINCFYPVKLFIFNKDTPSSGYGNPSLTYEVSILSNQNSSFSNIRYYISVNNSGFNNRSNGEDLIISGSYHKLNISYNILSITALGSWQNTCYIRVL